MSSNNQTKNDNNQSKGKGRPSGAAPRRRNNRQKKRPRNPKKKQIDSKPKATKFRSLNTVGGHNPAKSGEGVRSDIMVECNLEPKGLETFFTPLISMALVKGFKNDEDTPVYYGYTAALRDLVSIMSSGIGVVSTRLRYLNKILAAYKPKSVPFKTGTLAYSWLNADSAGVSSSISVRQYKFYMYIPTGSTLNQWDIQEAPSNPSSDEMASTVYASICTQVADNRVPFLQNDETSNFRAAYLKDVSPFAACSPYMGSSDTSNSSGPFYSAEIEVPRKSGILNGLCPYAPNNGRIPRVFSISSGSASAPVGLPFIPTWSMKYFNTCYPVQYCFLDLDEVCLQLQSWYGSLVEKVSSVGNGQNPLNSFTPFSQTPQQFRIAVRQCVLSLFAAAQSSSQYLTYSVDSGGFEPFRVGSNCFAKNRDTMRMPNLLVENLRMLLPRFLEVKTNFHNNKNVLVLIPVWGIYKAAVDNPLNRITRLWNSTTNEWEELRLFTEGGEAEDPNPIDGTFADGTVADLNSELVADLVTEWNERINELAAGSVPIMPLSGSADGTLLTYTRFAKYGNIDADVTKISKYMIRKLPPEYIRVIRKNSETKLPVIKKTPQTTPVVVEERRYVPPSSSLYSQRTEGISAIGAITNDVIALFNYFIFPTIILENNETPTQRQWRSGSTQCQIWDTPDRSTGTGFTSRGLKIDEAGGVCAPGIAASGNDEVASIIKTMSDHSRGGFIGDVLGTLATQLPF